MTHKQAREDLPDYPRTPDGHIDFDALMEGLTEDDLLRDSRVVKVQEPVSQH